MFLLKSAGFGSKVSKFKAQTVYLPIPAILMLIVVKELLLCLLFGLPVLEANVPEEPVPPAPRSPVRDVPAPPPAASKLDERCWPLRRPAEPDLAARASEEELEKLRAVVELRRLDAM